MKSANRDLLVLARHGTPNKGELDIEVEKLHKILFEAETMDSFCIANEIIDINRYKIFTDPVQIQKILKKKKVLKKIN